MNGAACAHSRMRRLWSAPERQGIAPANRPVVACAHSIRKPWPSPVSANWCESAACGGPHIQFCGSS